MAKTIIPHKCKACDKKLWFTDYDRNYFYHRGNYYCKDCFYNKRKKKKK